MSGSLIMDNTAENGAGVYADNTNAGKDSRAHMVSCTVTDNTAFIYRWRLVPRGWCYDGDQFNIVG